MAGKRAGKVKDAILDAAVDAFIIWATNEIKEKAPIVFDYLGKKAKKAVNSLNGKRGMRKLYKDTCQRAVSIGGSNVVRAVNEALNDLGKRDEFGKYICDYISTVNISITPTSWTSYYEMTNEEVLNDALSTGINHGVIINKSWIVDNLEKAGVNSDIINTIMDAAEKYIIPTKDLISGINYGLSKL